MALFPTVVRPISVLLLATALGAQVFVVDAAGGAGSHFTDLPAAVAVVPDGSTLRVRAGTYTAFVIDGKGLSIVGEGDVRVPLAPANNTAIVVRRTTASQPVLLKGLTLTTHGGSLWPAIGVLQAAGPVVFDSCKEVDVHFAIDASADVLFERCSLDASSFYQLTSTHPRLRVTDSVLELSSCVVIGQDQVPAPSDHAIEGRPALTLLRSRCVITNSTLRGGPGTLGCNKQAGPFRCWIVPPGAGGVGVAASASTLIVRGSTIAGANGVDEWLDVAGLVPAGNGGDGLRLNSGSRAILFGSAVIAGRGGSPTGRAGRVSILDASSALTSDPMALPTSLELRGAFTRGSVAEFFVRGAPNTPAVMLLAYRADVLPLEPLAYGSMLAAPDLMLGPFWIRASGETRVILPLTPNWPLGETYAAQALSIEPGTNTIWPSNRTILHVNR